MENVWELEGTIYKIYPEEQYGEFKKRYVVIECLHREYNNKQYSETVKFVMIGNKAADLNLYSENEKVKFGFTITGRKWLDPKKNNEEVFFNDVKIIWIQKLEVIATTSEQSSAQKVEEMSSDIESDLPF